MYLRAQVGGSCASCCQEAAGSVCVRSSTPTASRTPGRDTYDANLALGYSEDGRDYTVAAQMVDDLGLDRIALPSNNRDMAAQLDRLGVTVAERVPTAVHLNAINARYLATKAAEAHTR
jgi:GTP cyclohydrolase II